MDEAALLALEGRPRRAVPFGVAVALVVEVGVSGFGGRICDVDGDVSVESAPPTPDLRPRPVRLAVPGVSTKPGCSVFLPLRFVSRAATRWLLLWMRDGG